MPGKLVSKLTAGNNPFGLNSLKPIKIFLSCLIEHCDACRRSRSNTHSMRNELIFENTQPLQSPQLNYQIIGQFHKTYILIEQEDNLISG